MKQILKCPNCSTLTKLEICPKCLTFVFGDNKGKDKAEVEAEKPAKKDKK